MRNCCCHLLLLVDLNSKIVTKIIVKLVRDVVYIYAFLPSIFYLITLFVLLIFISELSFARRFFTTKNLFDCSCWLGDTLCSGGERQLAF